MLTYSYYSDKGSRINNEDSVGAFSRIERFCFVLCDGLGGHGYGDVASLSVIDIFKEIFSHREIKPKKFFREAFAASQQMLEDLQEANHAKGKMKTTAVSVVTDKRKARIAHIGDSRAYIFMKNGTIWHTPDHSVPQLLANTHEITEKEIRHHPDRNLVTKALGDKREQAVFEYDKTVNLKKCRALLLCSDGFWELIEDEQMRDCLFVSPTPRDWIYNMLKIIVENGDPDEMDNYSAIAVFTS